MNLLTAFFAAIWLAHSPAAAEEKCPVPDSFLSSDTDLGRAAKQFKTLHRLDISVVGTGSSTLPGPDGARFAYPARLEDALKRRLPGADIKVTVHIQSRKTTAEMTAELPKILAADKPALVVWQAGTFDAVKGIEMDDFSTSLSAGVTAINTAGADVALVNMQYSPRTESMINVTAYADVMRWVAQDRDTLLFDRLGIMRYWNEEGIFDLYAPTKKYDMARSVHDCIGRALASQIINAAHLKP